MNKTIMLLAIMALSTTAAANGNVHYHNGNFINQSTGQIIPAATGAQGAQGEQGNDGTDGVQGETGSQGSTGATGATGSTGGQGAVGLQGVQGEAGSVGASGDDGSNGSDGTDGTNGDNGAAGTSGVDGNAGVDGTNGTNGVDGLSLTAAAQSFTGDGVGVGVSGGRIPTQVSVVAGKTFKTNGRIIFGVTHQLTTNQTRVTMGVGWSF